LQLSTFIAFKETFYLDQTLSIRSRSRASPRGRRGCARWLTVSTGRSVGPTPRRWQNDWTTAPTGKSEARQTYRRKFRSG